MKRFEKQLKKQLSQANIKEEMPSAFAADRMCPATRGLESTWIWTSSPESQIQNSVRKKNVNSKSKFGGVGFGILEPIEV
jgi:hypothetical protein